MTIANVARAWATITNYASGPDVGTPSCVDPGAAIAAAGFIPGTPLAAQHLNRLLADMTSMQRRAFTIAGCKLREIRLDGTAISDTASSLAVVSSHGSDPGRANVLAIKTGQTMGFNDSATWVALGVPPSVTSNFNSAAYDPGVGRIVAIGAGGNRNVVSTDFGGSWSAGGTLGSDTVNWCTWNPVAGKFIVLRNSGFSSSTDGAVWTFPGATNAEQLAGLAVLANGDLVYVDSTSATVPAFRKVTLANITTTTNASAGGTVPNAATADDSGFIASNAAGTMLYHVCRRGSGQTLQISTSADGINWGVAATFAFPTPATYDSRPRVIACPNTGVLWYIAHLSSGLAEIRCSTDPTAVVWSDPMYMPVAPNAAFGAAGGRLVYTRGAQLFASDGFGWS